MKKLLTTFIEVVLFLFAAFSGFLRTIAPPSETNASFAVGIASFFVLIVLMLVSAIAREAPVKKFRRGWIKAGAICFLIALPLGLLYPWVLGKLTYRYPPANPVAQHVAGWELTETAKNFIRQNPGANSPGELEFNLPYAEIWTESSVSKAKLVLLLHYTALVLALSVAIFCLLEANIGDFSVSKRKHKSG
jgi:hypothetical protein